jgi:hypothetical protein
MTKRTLGDVEIETLELPRLVVTYNINARDLHAGLGYFVRIPTISVGLGGHIMCDRRTDIDRR